LSFFMEAGLVIYVETVFLNNFVIDLVICLLVYKTQKLNFCWWRIILVSIIGAIVAVLYPLLARYTIVIRVALSFIMVLLLVKYKSIWQFIVSLAIFYLATFCLGGAVLMLSASKYLVQHSKVIEFAPLIVALAIMLAYCIFSFVAKQLYAKRQKYALEYNVQVSTAFGECNAKAYYDSGNNIYDKEYKPVIVISNQLYNTLKGGEEEYLSVSTIGGLQLLKIIKVELKIYLEKDVNRIFSINAGISTKLKHDYDVILHADMIGG